MDIQKPEQDPSFQGQPSRSKPSPIQSFLNLLKKLPNPLKSIKPTKKLVFIVAAVVVVLIIRQIFFPPPRDSRIKKQDAQAQKPSDEDQIPIKVFKVGRFNFEDSLNALGTIKGGIEFKLSFEIPGVVSAINYREGERYEEGALLISLKQDDILLRLKRSQAEQQKASAAQSIAEDKYRDHQKLFEIGAIPQTTLDKVKYEVDQARYEVEAMTLEMKANEAILEKSNLYAPGAGTIGELNIEEGETLTQNTLVGTHVSLDRVVAQFGITEREINKISLGQSGKIFVDAYPDKVFEGTIENIAPVIIGTSRTADVRVRIENPESFLLPGMFARVKILLYQKKNTLVVPNDALQGKENEQYVYVVNPEDKSVKKTPIVVGYARVDYAQIDSGLREGDLIAVSGLDRLEDGSKAKIIETQEAEL
ncbi:MAG: efflux RND transporter periplasmic adaptor subunit [Candidatus Omnitrophica bacterium]|nr:efflux RND transporter periplasmic adaptor subunit [Candidatus Omnitrophota bacterium]